MAEAVQMKMVGWKLAGKMHNFTGVLNGTYMVKDGVALYAEGQSPRILIEHYGATLAGGAAVDAGPARDPGNEPSRQPHNQPRDEFGLELTVEQREQRIKDDQAALVKARQDANTRAKDEAEAARVASDPKAREEAEAKARAAMTPAARAEADARAAMTPAARAEADARARPGNPPR